MVGKREGDGSGIGCLQIGDIGIGETTGATAQVWNFAWRFFLRRGGSRCFYGSTGLWFYDVEVRSTFLWIYGSFVNNVLEISITSYIYMKTLAKVFS